MNNSRFNKAIKELRTVGMNPHEKAALHERLMARIKTGQAGAVGGAIPTPLPGYSFMAWMGDHRFSSMAVAALAVVIFGGGGLAFAAEGALPGDSLYPVKIALIEPIHGAFFVSADARAQWEARLVANRLKEADTLAQKGDTDASKQEEIRILVAEHTEAYNDARKNSRSPEALAEAQIAIDQGATFLAASDASTGGMGGGSAVMSAMSVSLQATATAKTGATAPSLLKQGDIKAADGIIHATSAVGASPATSSDPGLSLPHLPDTKDVKDLIKETSAVVNAMSKVETASAATTSPNVPSTTPHVVPPKI